MKNIFVNSILQRLKRKSLSNQIAIAVGSYLSDAKYSIPSLSQELIQNLKIDVKVNSGEEFFRVWNEVIEKAEKKIGREKVKAFIAERTRGLALGFSTIRLHRCPFPIL